MRDARRQNELLSATMAPCEDGLEESFYEAVTLHAGDDKWGWVEGTQCNEMGDVVTVAGLSLIHI